MQILSFSWKKNIFFVWTLKNKMTHLEIMFFWSAAKSLSAILLFNRQQRKSPPKLFFTVYYLSLFVTFMFDFQFLNWLKSRLKKFSQIRRHVYLRMNGSHDNIWAWLLYRSVYSVSSHGQNYFMAIKNSSWCCCCH